MKTLLLLLLCLFAAGPGPDSPGTMFMFWNLENFFDYRDSGQGGSDAEFSSMGERHWTKTKFYRKCLAAAKTILWISDTYGDLPDVVGVAEVENSFVVGRLVNTDVLKKHGYGFIHYDSPDRRGIDVALLYRKEVFDTLESRSFRIDARGPDGKELNTRDILMVKLRRKDSGDTLVAFVNHHPSKYGGGSTEWRREAAVERLRSLADSLHSCGIRNIVAMGDFNDTPDNQLFHRLTENGCLHLMEPAAGKGTIRFNGKWEMIDLFFVSGGIMDRNPVMVIPNPPFLTARDPAHSGDKPLRTYSGPRYNGGVSDHRPVLLMLD